MDKTTIKAAFITGILGIIGAIAAAVISNNIGAKEAVNQIVSQVNVDTVDIDNINDLIDSYNQLGNENLHLREDNMKLYSDSEKLREQNKLLLSEKESLSVQIEQLQDEIRRLKDNSNTQNSVEQNAGKQSVLAQDSFDENNTPAVDVESFDQKISIFDLDASREKSFSYDYSAVYLGSNDIGNNIDTYGYEYSTGCLRFHSTRPTEETTPTYVLNQEYTMCEGKIAWLKRYKNSPGSIWIEFYEGDSLIYKTESIEALDGAMRFEFSVEGCNELTVVANSSNMNMYVIYPYFNLIRQ